LAQLPRAAESASEIIRALVPIPYSAAGISLSSVSFAPDVLGTAWLSLEAIAAGPATSSATKKPRRSGAFNSHSTRIREAQSSHFARSAYGRPWIFVQIAANAPGLVTFVFD
jgi:hypothetical protein